jgi:hypothetical protein
VSSRPTTPTLMLVGLLLASSLACSLGRPESTDLPAPTDPPASEDAPLPVEVPATEAPPPSTACDPVRVIERLSAEMPREQAAFFYSGAFVPGEGAVLRLSFWFVDYRINPSVGPDPQAILNNAGMALESAINWVRYFENADPCVEELFVLLNPIAVDREYNGWISLDVPSGVLPDGVGLSDLELGAAVEQNVVFSSVRRTAPAPSGSPGAGACDWTGARDGLEAAFGPPPHGNTAFFFVRDDQGNNVWAYLDNTAVTLAPEDNFNGQVAQILDEIACLHPGPDNLIVHTQGEGGIEVFSGRLPRSGIASGDLGQFVDFP